MPTASISHSALLRDRSVVSVSGRDAVKFLDGLVTNDLSNLDATSAVLAGLLSPQGKILFDFLVMRDGAAFRLDVAADKAAGLVARLAMYKLRADVMISDWSPDAPVSAAWGDDVGSAGFIDTRDPGLGRRRYGSDVLPTADAAAYHTHRIALGVPEGGRDYAWGDAFPHEANYDRLNGVSFTKGCYVGQEIVARMEHRGTARKRILRVTGAAPLPPMGTPVCAGEVAIGTLGSSTGHGGLAMLRLDRVAEFAALGVGLTCGGHPVVADAADLAAFAPRPADAASPF